MTEDNQPVAKGRGAAIRPQNRFVSTHSEPDLEQVGEDREYLESLRSHAGAVPNPAGQSVSGKNCCVVGNRSES